MSQQYASVPLVTTPEEKETAFTVENVAREGLIPAEKIENVAQACVDKDSEDVIRAMEERQQLYTENKDK